MYPDWSLLALTLSTNRAVTASRRSECHHSDRLNPGVAPWCGFARNTPDLWSVRSATAHLQLAIDVDSDPISGSVSNGDELTEPFMGWIELTAAIEAARSTSHGGEASPAEVGVDGKTLGSHPGANGGHA